MVSHMIEAMIWFYFTGRFSCKLFHYILLSIFTVNPESILLQLLVNINYSPWYKLTSLWVCFVVCCCKAAERYRTVHTNAGAFYISQVRLFMMKPLQKPHTIRKQLSGSNLFMSDMLFLMKALAALYNQLAISELIFHPAIVMSSPGTGIIHNSPCYDKLRPRAREVYERFWAPCQVCAICAGIIALGLLVDHMK